MLKGLSFKNIHSSTIDGLYMTTDSVTLYPATRDEYSYIRGRAGSILDADEPEDIVKEVQFAVQATDKADLKNKARLIANWLYSSGKEKLKFDDENVYYIGKVANQADIAHEIEQVGEFTVLFRCDPYALSEQKTATANITTSGQSLTIVNDGTAPTPPIIIIKNTGATTINNFTLEFTSVEG